jgi:hypothetical protein
VTGCPVKWVVRNISWYACAVSVAWEPLNDTSRSRKIAPGAYCARFAGGA